MMIKRTKKEENESQGRGKYKNNKEEDEEQGEAMLTHRGKRSIANSTSKTSVGPRVTWTALLVIHLACMISQGLEIDPKPTIRNETSNKQIQRYTYCLGSGEPIRFLDPFDPAILQRNRNDILALYWSVTRTGQREQWVMDFFPSVGVDVIYPRISAYEFWGLEVTNVTEADAGVYKVVLAKTTGELRGDMEVVMAAAPVLASEKLVLHTQEVDDSVHVTCREITSLGDPPVKLQLKTSDGQVLNDVLAQGTLSVTLPKNQDTNGFVCEVDWNTSLAASCLTENEKKAWHAAIQIQGSSHDNNEGTPNQTSASLDADPGWSHKSYSTGDSPSTPPDTPVMFYTDNSELVDEWLKHQIEESKVRRRYYELNIRKLELELETLEKARDGE